MSSADSSAAIRSMTGYGQASGELGAARLSVEVRAVNHRYADLRMRLPAELAAAEAELRRVVLRRVKRGRVEIGVTVTTAEGDDAGPVFNERLVAVAVAAARRLRDDHGLVGEPDVATLLGLPGAFRVETPVVEWNDTARAVLGAALERALDGLESARRREGEHLTRDLLERLTAMRGVAAAVAERARALPPRIAERLRERLGALAGELALDPARVAQEAAHLADRCDVTEETVRLASHLDQAVATLERPDAGPHGKRLDFLVQEMQRETNTITSKSSDLELTRLALDLKAETEKIREQVQNIE